MPAVNTIQLRRDTAANWTSVNPVLAAGELGFETDTRLIKAGDGSTVWTSLAYVPSETANKISGKRVFVQTTTPTAPAGGFSVGDVWISY
jgi:hypothetical protein